MRGANLYPPCPVIIRGQHFPSISKASQALGVQSSAICAALDRHGHADFVGLGYRKGMRKGNRNARRKPVQIGPHRFDSQADLARFIGWTPWRVGCALKATASDAQRGALLAAVMQADRRAA